MTITVTSSRTASRGDAHPAEGAAPSGPTVIRTIGRCLIAAAGMMACAIVPSLPYAVPAYAEWVAVPHTGVDQVLLVAAELGRYTLSIALASVLLLLAARVEGVRLRDYFGGVPARRAWVILVGVAVGVAAVTTTVVGLVKLSGLDADRAVGASTAGLPLVLVLAVGLGRAFLLQGIQEEWWLRGFAVCGYERRPWLVLGASAAVFTLLHLVSSGGQQSMTERLLYLAVPLGMGVWAGVERWCTGTVWGSVGVHGGVHTGMIAPTLLGWPMGPAAWVAVGAGLTLAAALRLAFARPWRTAPATDRSPDLP